MAKQSKNKRDISANRSKRRGIRKNKIHYGQKGGAAAAPTRGYSVKTNMLENINGQYKLKRELHRKYEEIKNNIIALANDQNNLLDVINPGIRDTKISEGLIDPVEIILTFLDIKPRRSETVFQSRNEFREWLKRQLSKDSKIEDENGNLDKMKLTIYKLKDMNHWQTVANQTNSATGFYTFGNGNLMDANEKDLSREANKKATDQYIENCDELQKKYNAKHNEIIDLYETLRGLIESKLELVNIILGILNIANVRRDEQGGITGYLYPYNRPEYQPKYQPEKKIGYEDQRNKYRIKLPKGQKTVAELTKYFEEQARLLIDAKRVLEPKQQGGSSQYGPQSEFQSGGAAAAPPTIPVNGVENVAILQALQQITSQENAHFNMLRRNMIPTDEMRIANPNGDTNPDGDSAQGVELTIKTFNNTSTLQHIIYKCFDLQNLYLIKHNEFMNLFKIILYFMDMFLSNLALLEYILSIINGTINLEETAQQGGAQGTPEQASSESSAAAEQEQEEELTSSSSSASAAASAAASFQQPIITLPKSTVKNLSARLEQQSQIMGSISRMGEQSTPPKKEEKKEESNGDMGFGLFNGGGNESAPPEQLTEETFKNKINELGLQLQDYQYSYSNLQEFEHKILDLIKSERDSGKLNKLYKAFLLIRIARLERHLSKKQDQNNDKITKAIEYYNRQLESITDLEKPISVGDFAARINEYADFVLGDDIFKKIKENLEKRADEAAQLPTTATYTEPFEESIIALNKTLSSMICQRGNRESCDAAVLPLSKNVIKTFMRSISFLNITHDQINGFYTEPINTFGINHVAAGIANQYQNFEQPNDRTREKAIKILEGLKINDESQNQIASETDKAYINELIDKLIESINGAILNETERLANTNSARENVINNSGIPTLAACQAELLKNPESRATIVGDIANEIKGLSKDQNITKDALNALLEAAPGINQQLINAQSLEDVNRIISQFKEAHQILPTVQKYMYILLETIMGSALVMVRVNDKNEESKFKGDSKPKTITEFANSQTQQGGAYTDYTTIQKAPGIGSTIKLGQSCLREDETSETYGPFFNVFTPDYNNYHIYGHLFGYRDMASKDEPNPIKPPNIQDPNIPRNLIQKLEAGGNVVLFGYGFSGSGKTYTLIEGDSKKGDKSSDPSMLELFISGNADRISKIEFSELYPKGITVEKADGKEEIIRIIKNEGENNPKYAPIEKPDSGQITFADVKQRIDGIEKLRREKLRILATPNNPDSSRSFFMITIKLKNIDGSDGGQLVLIDMPGTENTMRIKAEFLGAETFKAVAGIQLPEKTNEYICKGTAYQLCTKFKKLININTTAENKIISFTTKEITRVIPLKTAKTVKEIKDAKIKAINDYYNNLTERNDITKGFDRIIFKDLLVEYVKFSTLLGFANINQTEGYKLIADTNEGLILFFNKRTEKTMQQFLINTIESNPSITLKVLDTPAKISIIKSFIDKVINNNDNLEFVLPTPTKLENKPKDFDAIDYDKIRKIYGFTADQFNQNKQKEQKTYNFKDAFLTGLYDNAKSFKNFQANKPSQEYYIQFKDNKKNPMIIYFIKLLTLILQNAKESDYDSVLGAVVIIIYKYVSFICEQGSAISTTLEHLKYFFLSNTPNNGLANYNASHPNQAFNGDFQTKPKFYQIETDIGNNIILQENVNMGETNSYGLLKILQDFNQTTPQKSLFVMLAHIRTYGNTPGEPTPGDTQMICTFERDTLEFINDISSTSQFRGPDADPGAAAAAVVPKGGYRSIKPRYKTHRNRTIKRRHPDKRRRTRKYY